MKDDHTNVEKTELWTQIATIRRRVRKLSHAAAILNLHDTCDYLDRASNSLQQGLDAVDD